MQRHKQTTNEVLKVMIKFEELSSSIDELIKTRMHAEKEYEENLFIYACCPVGTDGKN